MCVCVCVCAFVILVNRFSVNARLFTGVSDIVITSVPRDFVIFRKERTPRRSLPAYSAVHCLQTVVKPC